MSGPEGRLLDPGVRVLRIEAFKGNDIWICFEESGVVAGGEEVAGVYLCVVE